MKIERTKNAMRNMFFGSILKVYQIIVPFLMRTAMIYFMGVEYLGLNSLFASVLQVLNLAELGVGSAMVYSMYKPIAEDDTKQICALMKLYRTYYRIIGLVIAILGCILLPFIPQLIEGEIPSDVNIYVLYLLNLGSTVLSYWLFSYKNCLLTAHQRIDVVNKVMLLMSTIQYVIQMFVMVFLKNYYLYYIVLLVTQAISNIITALIATKLYPQYHAKGILEKTIVLDINKRIRDLFTSKIGAVMVNSVDTIVISAFLGLKMLAVYQNYFYILNSILGFVSVIFSSCMAGIGNSIVVETKEKNFNDFKKFTFIVSWIAGFCTCCLVCLYQPFMELWTGKEFMLNFSAVICFGIYYFVMEINQLLNIYKDAAGIWHQDRFRPLVTAIANLGMNLLMVQFFGVYGVLLSTVFSALFVGMPWLLNNLFTILFEKKQLRSYIKTLFKYGFISMVVCIVTYIVCACIRLDGWGALFSRMFVCCLVPNILFLIIYQNDLMFFQSIELIEKITNGRFVLAKVFFQKGRRKKND